MGNLFNQPTPPSPGAGLPYSQQAGQQQQSFNVASQAGSMVNQTNPYGSLNYVQTGTGPNGVPIYTARTNLSPAQQQLLNERITSQTMAGGLSPELLAAGNYGAPGGPGVAIGDMTSGLTGQMLGSEVNYLEPFFNLQKTQEDAQLQNQGFKPGTTAYNNAMFPVMTGQDLAVSNFLAQAEPQAFQQATTKYTLPMTMSEQLSQWGMPTMPGGQFVSTPSLGSVNSIGAYNTAQGAANQQYQAQQAQYNAMIGALGQVAGAGLNMVAPGMGTMFDMASNATGYYGQPQGQYEGNIYTPANPYVSPA